MVFTLSKVKEVHQISAWVFYLSTNQGQGGLDHRFMGLVSSLRSGDERDMARPGQARPGVQGMGWKNSTNMHVNTGLKLAEQTKKE
jgi:hypothetical protein